MAGVPGAEDAGAGVAVVAGALGVPAVGAVGVGGVAGGASVGAVGVDGPDVGLSGLSDLSGLPGVVDVGALGAGVGVVVAWASPDTDSQPGQALGPRSASSFSAMAICWSLVACEGSAAYSSPP
ncbi:hypothetical protein [Kitasatospora azatica]|uniref:hypothetical protein n=1 Tax=Kitasatospora azatica TaxID=58347 RepID=UPI00068D5113|nr:hypothetical protein [Kitasatospora azatica]